MTSFYRSYKKDLNKTGLVNITQFGLHIRVHSDSSRKRQGESIEMLSYPTAQEAEAGTIEPGL